jgi:hypothetical protein
MYNKVPILQRTLLQGDKDSFVLHSENTRTKCFANGYSDGFNVVLIPSRTDLRSNFQVGFNCSFTILTAQCVSHPSLHYFTAKQFSYLKSEFLTTDPGVPDSIPGHYKKKKRSGSGMGSTQPREYN